ncbi:hypothetical protein K443DRAFT_558299 [Laccaria amethystina LaAM-08-1]|jgi:hypothetical protein|uniref:Uncharacterized protein n=1 Tax=Laccaria amethystina LaAM-08-1 TaxID=1095629 RepID=A0A0C9X851_9AGAR|nr:hypothetical protein K443DRAFT_558299 [Laccaria amethystina LaAM-08-1]
MVRKYVEAFSARLMMVLDLIGTWLNGKRLKTKTSTCRYRNQGVLELGQWGNQLCKGLNDRVHELKASTRTLLEVLARPVNDEKCDRLINNHTFRHQHVRDQRFPNGRIASDERMDSFQRKRSLR